MLKPTFNNVLLQKRELKRKSGIVVAGKENEVDTNYTALVVIDVGPEVHKQIKKGKSVIINSVEGGFEQKIDDITYYLLPDVNIIAIK